MKIGAPKEVTPGENRVALTPESALQLQKLAVGVEVVKTAAALWKAVDVVIKVRPPETAEAKRLTAGQTLISFFWPAQNAELMELCQKQGATVIAMDMVPRISRAQKMDALSSMANLAGYRAVIEAGTTSAGSSPGR
jgi:H+-translocating NAD(P) transhydrogenase subunit alpha